MTLVFDQGPCASVLSRCAELFPQDCACAVGEVDLLGGVRFDPAFVLGLPAFVAGVGEVVVVLEGRISLTFRYSIWEKCTSSSAGESDVHSSLSDPNTVRMFCLLSTPVVVSSTLLALSFSPTKTL